MTDKNNNFNPKRRKFLESSRDAGAGAVTAKNAITSSVTEVASTAVQKFVEQRTEQMAQASGVPKGSPLWAAQQYISLPRNRTYIPLQEIMENLDGIPEKNPAAHMLLIMEYCASILDTARDYHNAKAIERVAHDNGYPDLDMIHGENILSFFDIFLDEVKHQFPDDDHDVPLLALLDPAHQTIEKDLNTAAAQAQRMIDSAGLRSIMPDAMRLLTDPLNPENRPEAFSNGIALLDAQRDMLVSASTLSENGVSLKQVPRLLTAQHLTNLDDFLAHKESILTVQNILKQLQEAGINHGVLSVMVDNEMSQDDRSDTLRGMLPEPKRAHIEPPANPARRSILTLRESAREDAPANNPSLKTESILQLPAPLEEADEEVSHQRRNLLKIAAALAATSGTIMIPSDIAPDDLNKDGVSATEGLAH